MLEALPARIYAKCAASWTASEYRQLGLLAPLLSSIASCLLQGE